MEVVSSAVAVEAGVEARRGRGGEIVATGTDCRVFVGLARQ